MSEVLNYIDDLTRKIDKEKLNGKRPHVIAEYHRKRTEIANIKDYDEKLNYTFSTVSYMDRTIRSERLTKREEINTLKKYLFALIAHSKLKKDRVVESFKEGKKVLKQELVALSIEENTSILEEIQRIINQINHLENE